MNNLHNQHLRFAHCPICVHASNKFSNARPRFPTLLFNFLFYSFSFLILFDRSIIASSVVSVLNHQYRSVLAVAGPWLSCDKCGCADGIPEPWGKSSAGSGRSEGDKEGGKEEKDNQIRQRPSKKLSKKNERAIIWNQESGTEQSEQRGRKRRKKRRKIVDPLSSSSSVAHVRHARPALSYTLTLWPSLSPLGATIIAGQCCFWGEGLWTPGKGKEIVYRESNPDPVILLYARLTILCLFFF